MTVISQDPFEKWFQDKQAAILRQMTFKELRKGVQAVSSLYVERRNKLSKTSRICDGIAKRAAFGFYYGTLHFLVVRKIVEALPMLKKPARSVLDLGCGTGMAGVAFCAGMTTEKIYRQVIGIDQSADYLREAQHNYRVFEKAYQFRGSVKKSNIEKAPLPESGDTILISFCVNELTPTRQNEMCQELLKKAHQNKTVLIVEPLAERLTPFWTSWKDAFLKVGGRCDTWRFQRNNYVPDFLQELSLAAGLGDEELLAKSLFLENAGLD